MVENQETGEQMARETWNASKAGRSDVEVRFVWLIPLADPEKEGNGGLQGYDDESHTTTCPNLGLARYAARQFVLKTQKAQPGATNFSVTLIEQTWQADSYPDEDYGTIFDAYAVGQYQTDGYWDPEKQDFVYDERTSCPH